MEMIIREINKVRLLEKINREKKSQSSLRNCQSAGLNVNQLRGRRVPFRKYRCIPMVNENMFIVQKEKSNKPIQALKLPRNRLMKLWKVRESILKLIQEEFPRAYTVDTIHNVQSVVTEGTVLVSQSGGMAGLTCNKKALLYMYGGVGSPLRDNLTELCIADNSYSFSQPWKNYSAPICRYGHTLLTYDSKRLLIFGGEFCPNQTDIPFSQTKMYELMGCFVFQPQTKQLKKLINVDSPGPSPRKYHSACLLGRRFLLVFGGMNIEQIFDSFEKDQSIANFLKEFWVLDIYICKWTRFPLADRSQIAFRYGLIFHQMVSTYHYTLDQRPDCLKGEPN